MKHRGRIRSACGFVACVLTLTMAGFSAGAQEQERYVSEVEIWKMIIRDSIASYPHLCPCPYSANRAGRACGDRSVYSRVNNGSLICYPQDIPDSEIARYRELVQ